MVRKYYDTINPVYSLLNSRTATVTTLCVFYLLSSIWETSPASDGVIISEVPKTPHPSSPTEKVSFLCNNVRR